MSEGKREKLIKLREKALKDDSLPLKQGATKLVFGAGSPEAEILCLGEGPGYWEDQRGIPFIGNAGKLLDQLLQSIKLERETVFISNMIMYRPPNNRDPESEELEAFSPYVDGIIDIIAPKLIITLGRFSMAKFLPGVLISNVHGKVKVVDWKDRKIVVVPMYHPAAGLRNGQIKERLKFDFAKLPQILEDIETLVSKDNDDKKEKDSKTDNSDKIESEQIRLC